MALFLASPKGCPATNLARGLSVPGPGAGFCRRRGGSGGEDTHIVDVNTDFDAFYAISEFVTSLIFREQRQKAQMPTSRIKQSLGIGPHSS